MPKFKFRSVYVSRFVGKMAQVNREAIEILSVQEPVELP